MDSLQQEQFILSEKKGSLRFFALIVTVITVFLVLLGNAVKIPQIVSLGTRVLISFIFLVGAVNVFQILAAKKANVLSSLFILLIVMTLVAVFVRGVSSLISHYVQYMCFLMLPAYIVSYSRIDGLGSARKIIFAANFAYATMFIILSRSRYSHVFYNEWGTQTIKDLTLGFNNPNETAIYLFVSFVIMFAAVFSTHKHYAKVISGLYTVYLAYLIYQTHCRAGIVLAALCIILKLLMPIFKIGKWTLRIVLIIPALYAVLLLINPGVFSKLFLLGEAAETGRYEMYDSFIVNVSFISAVFGNFSVYAGNNLHNSFLTIFAMFGLPTAIAYFGFLYRGILSFLPRARDNVSYIGLIGVVCLFLHGVAEGTLLVAGTVYAGLFSLLILLMIPERPEMSEE